MSIDSNISQEKIDEITEQRLREEEARKKAEEENAVEEERE